MKLIAKHKDFYDHFARNLALSDQTYKWVRTPRVVKVNFALPRPVHLGTGYWIRRPSNCARSDEVEAVGFVVWFCGRAIPVAKVSRTTWSTKTLSSTKTESYVFSFNDLPSDLVSEEDKTRKWKLNARYGLTNKEHMLALFQLGNQPWMSANIETIRLDGRAIPNKLPIDEMHRIVGSPVFCHSGVIPEAMGQEHAMECVTGVYNQKSEVIINPVMSMLGLHKHLDSFEVFKDLERYLANELAPKDLKRDMSVIEKAIPDTVKAESHGFNKHSFRKDPSKKSKGKHS